MHDGYGRDGYSPLLQSLLFTSEVLLLIFFLQLPANCHNHRRYLSLSSLLEHGTALRFRVSRHKQPQLHRSHITSKRKEKGIRLCCNPGCHPVFWFNMHIKCRQELRYCCRTALPPTGLSAMMEMFLSVYNTEATIHKPLRTKNMTRVTNKLYFI